MSEGQPGSTDPHGAVYLERFERALARLEAVRPFAKVTAQQPVLDAGARLLQQPDGLAHLARHAPRFDAAGLFTGSDWNDPASLLPQFVEHTLRSPSTSTVTLECLSELRLLAIARGDAHHEGVAPEQARHFLTQVLALNLGRVLGGDGEAERQQLGPLAPAVTRLFRYLLNEIGFEDTLDSLIAEIWRILDQRPLQVVHVKAMITQIAVHVARGGLDLGSAGLGADRLVSALFRPTRGCEEDPGVAVYVERLEALDKAALQAEARGFARAMHDTGLVSDYHAVFLRWLNERDQRETIGAALGLSTTGVDVLRCFPALIQRLIADAVHPATAQCVYGLAMLLERGLLYQPPVAPALWRQIHLAPSPSAAATLTAMFGAEHPPQVHLLAGVVSILGQPLGVGQGHNPTCQAARALSMWSLNDPDYLLHLLTQVARTDSITMNFEGRPLRSAELAAGLVNTQPLDTDAVSALLVPHLDRVYAEMGRICAERGQDPHRWINPEFHGWWVGREFAIAVDVATGALADHEAFVRGFYGHYHPYHNGSTPVIHPQPAGLAITDSSGAFVGWHAITLLRVALDQEDVMRAYFYNPNNDSGQHWGDGVVVSTQGHGERHGEASLPFPQLASRLYIFHFDSTVCSPTVEVPADEVREVMERARRTWAADRVPPAPDAHVAS